MTNKVRIKGYEFTYELDLEAPEELKGMELGLVTDEIYKIDSDGLHHYTDVWTLKNIDSAIEEAFEKAIEKDSLDEINLWYVKKIDKEIYEEIIDGNKYSPVWVKNIRNLKEDRIKKLEKALYKTKNFECIDDVVEAIKKAVADDVEGDFKIDLSCFENWGDIELEFEDLEDDITVKYDLEDGIAITDIY